jgi:hypothetical protein
MDIPCDVANRADFCNADVAKVADFCIANRGLQGAPNRVRKSTESRDTNAAKLWLLNDQSIQQVYT